MFQKFRRWLLRFLQATPNSDVETKSVTVQLNDKTVREIAMRQEELRSQGRLH